MFIFICKFHHSILRDYERLCPGFLFDGESYLEAQITNKIQEAVLYFLCSDHRETT